MNHDYSQHAWDHKPVDELKALVTKANLTPQQHHVGVAQASPLLAVGAEPLAIEELALPLNALPSWLLLAAHPDGEQLFAASVG